MKTQTNSNNLIQAIENVLDKRMHRGASDESLIAWLKHLKSVWKSNYMHNVLDGFIDAIKQTPLVIKKAEGIK